MEKKDINLCNFGVNALLSHTITLEKEISGIRDLPDVENIHQMRVATRRIHSVLSNFNVSFPQREIKSWEKSFLAFRKSLGKARDLDVRLDLIRNISKSELDKQFQPGFHRLILRLEQARVKQHSAVNQSLEDLTKKQVIQNIKKYCVDFQGKHPPDNVYSSGLYTLSAKMISRCYDDVAKLEPYISDPDCITEIHLLRIAIKRLRYSVEIFSPLYPDGLASAQKMLRKAQEMTGDIHDCDVWILYILDFIAKERMKFQRFYGNKRYYSRLEPGIQYFKQDRTEHRNDTYQNFVSDWQKWKEDKILEITLDVTRHYVVTDNYQYHPAKSSNH